MYLASVLIAFFVVLVTAVYWLRGRKDKSKPRICVLVLGDVGRSPRMQYHALSCAKAGFDVDLVGFGGMWYIGLFCYIRSFGAPAWVCGGVHSRCMLTRYLNFYHHSQDMMDKIMVLHVTTQNYSKFLIFSFFPSHKHFLGSNEVLIIFEIKYQVPLRKINEIKGVAYLLAATL